MAVGIIMKISEGGKSMSDYGYNGTCNECGANYGDHYSDCSDNIGTGRSYKSSMSYEVRDVLFFLAIILMGLFPPLGCLLFFILLHI